jgi:hypothetical protein
MYIQLYVTIQDITLCQPQACCMRRGQRWRPVQPTAGGQCNLVLQLPASPGCALLAARTLWRASTHTTQPWQASCVGWASSRPAASEGRKELDEEDRRKHLRKVLDLEQLDLASASPNSTTYIPAVVCMYNTL